MTLSDLTTAELQRAARAVMRTYLDVESGRVAASSLRRFLASDATRHVAAQPARLTVNPGPLRHDALGPVSLLRLSSDRAYACAAAPLGGTEAWAVVSVELAAEGDRLTAVGVGRVSERSARQDVTDREAPAVGDGQALPDPPPHLGRVLGAIPKDASARVRWLTAAAVIDTYRERYQIDDAHIAFGSQPAEGEQRTERERAVAYTRELVQQIDRAEHDRSIAGVGRDRPPGPELGR